MAFTLTEIADWIDAEIDGDSDLEIDGLAKIEDAKAGQLSFIANPKYHKFIETTHASAVLVNKDFPESSKNLLRVENPYYSFLICARHFYHQQQSIPKGIHETAVISPDAVLSDNTAIGPYVYIGRESRIGTGCVLHPGVVIGDNVTIGDNTVIYANVTIREQCRIGKNCILHMGAVIGSDGFGFAFEGGQYHKLPQMGNVIIEDDVEVGANTTIDRATLGSTIIHRGTKLDNLIQIAHNVSVGEHTAIAAQTGISGSTKIGNYVMIGGQAGFVGHVTVGDKAKVGAQAGVTKSVPEDTYVSGYPARPAMKEKRELAHLAGLPDLVKRIKELELKVKGLSEKKGS